MVWHWTEQVWLGVMTWLGKTVVLPTEQVMLFGLGGLTDCVSKTVAMSTEEMLFFCGLALR